MNLRRRYQNVLAEFLRRVLEKYRDRIERIVLVGSVARGTAGEDTDLESMKLVY